jgi:protein TonB
MGKIITKTLQRNSFWLALLLHLLIFFIFAIFLIPKKMLDENRELTIPSFLYQESTETPIAHSEAPKQKRLEKKKIPVSENGIEKPVTEHAPQELNQLVPKSAAESSEPVHLVGEKGVAKPLIILLGKALTAHLAYPKIAIDLNIRGVPVIGFVVHPDGRVTDIRLVKSSSTDILDKAAIQAAQSISPVKNVGLYLKEPKYIIFGIIFGSRT